MWDTNSRSDLLIARREERTGVGVDHPNVAEVRQTGMAIAIEMVQDKAYKLRQLLYLLCV